MTRRHAAATLLSLSLTTAGAQAGMNVFSFTSPTARVLLTWTEAGGQLTGSLQLVTGTASAQGPKFDVTTNVVRGTRSGSSYSFVLENKVAFFGSSALSGTLAKDTLTLMVPSKEGGFTSFPLSRTTLEKFNASVATLRSTLTQQSNTLAAAATKRAEEERARQQAEAARQEAAQRLTDALETHRAALTRADGLLDDAQDTLDALDRTFQDIASVQAGKRQVLTDLKRLAAAKDCYAFNERKADLYGYGLVSLVGEGRRHVSDLNALPNRLDAEVTLVNDSRVTYLNLKGNRAELPADRDLAGRVRKLKVTIAQRVAAAEVRLDAAASGDAALVKEAEGLTCSAL